MAQGSSGRGHDVSNEPRVPKGSGDKSGEWTTAGGSMSERRKGPVHLNERGNPVVEGYDAFRGMTDDDLESLGVNRIKPKEVELPYPVPTQEELDGIPLKQLKEKRDRLKDELAIAEAERFLSKGVGKFLPWVGRAGRAAGTISAVRLKQHIAAYDRAIAQRRDGGRGDALPDDK